MRRLIPTIDDALDLTVEELGYAILSTLQGRSGKKLLHAGNTFNELTNAYDPAPHERTPASARKAEFQSAVAEALSWLSANGLVATVYEANYTYLLVTRRGLSLNSREAFQGFVDSSFLRREALHPNIQVDAWLLYVRGKFDLAVLAAFKQVEVAVRDAIDAPLESFGVPLMRDAFHKDTGRLTDKSLPVSERDAIAHLFSGSIGAFKNPNSHRNVGLDSPARAAELLMLASHLLSIVDERRARG